jgi:fucose permease
VLLHLVHRPRERRVCPAGHEAGLGLTPSIYGLGAGLFFIGYFVFEVPSNLILERIGARVWIARIMITWGIGNLSGFLAPYLIGAIKDSTGSVHLALALLAILPFAAMILTWQVQRLQTALASG